jgi:multisubunit Na+/H+ antiporter MnhE subunit
VSGVLNPTKKFNPDILADSDMAGPLVFCLILGFFLLLTGKVHFGYIYGFGGLGCLAMYAIINLMAENQSVDISRTFSVLGYCLLPIVVLSAVAIFVSLKNSFGVISGIVTALWCAQSATRFFEAALQMRQQRYLIAYPSFLLYAVFVLFVIF